MAKGGRKNISKVAAKSSREPNAGAITKSMVVAVKNSSVRHVACNNKKARLVEAADKEATVRKRKNNCKRQDTLVAGSRRTKPQVALTQTNSRKPSATELKGGVNRRHSHPHSAIRRSKSTTGSGRDALPAYYRELDKNMYRAAYAHLRTVCHIDDIPVCGCKTKCDRNCQNRLLYM